MGSNRIRGITIEVGGDTTKLDKALAGTDKQLKQTTANLKDVERLLKMDPGNVELLTQKQRLLTEAVEGTRERLHTLETAAEQANEALANGEMSQAQYDALNREIIETQHNLEELTQAANDFDIDQAIRDAEDALRNLSDEADNASDNMDDLSDSSGGASGGLGGLAGVAAGAAMAIGSKLVEAAISAAQWIWNLDEATEEYREAMGKLNTAFESAGYSIQTAQQAYQGFYNILGDTDTATEASQLLGNMFNRTEELAYITGLLTDEYGLFANNIPVDALIQAAAEAARTGEVTGSLAEAIEQAGGSAEGLAEKLKTAGDGAEGFNRLKAVSDELASSLFKDSDTAARASQAFYELGIKTGALSEWAEISAGVYATFGDSLPIEGLIEAANETAKVGQVTGVLADALNWAGMSEDELNDALSKTADEGDRALLIMNNLSLAYRDAAAAFYEYNETLIETRENQAQLDAVQAQLGESVARLKSKFFDLFGPIVIRAVEQFTAVLEQIIWVVDKIGQGLEWLGQKIKDVVGFFQELFGVSKQASNVSVASPKAGSRALEAPYSLQPATAENLPYLAQGTVTRPNSPFMAVVGDNPNEPEIVSPLSTIEQAVRNVVGSSSQASNVRVTVNFTGSAAQLVRMLQPQIVAETNRLGPNFAP